MSEKRITSIDFLRGFAALSVCLYHFTQGNPDYLSSHSILKWLGSFGWMGVQVFFVISGYVIPYTLHKHNYQWQNFPFFLLKRVIRIEIPYVFSIGLVLLSFYVVASYRHEVFSINLNQLLLHLLYLNTFFNYQWLSPVYWTLAIEFQYYILIGLMFPFLHQANFKKYLSFITLFLLSIFFPQEHLIFHYLPLFLLGILCFQLQFKIITKFDFYILNIPCLGFIYLNFGLVCMILISFVIFILIFWQSEEKGSPWLGKISYSLYLVHVPFGGRLIGLSEVWLQGDWSRSGIIFIVLGLTLGFAYLFYKFIELPAIQLSKKI